MARRKKDTKETTKKKTKKEEMKLNSGAILYIDNIDLPGTTLGSIYEYKGNQVRLLCIGIDKSKLEVL